MSARRQPWRLCIRGAGRWGKNTLSRRTAIAATGPVEATIVPGKGEPRKARSLEELNTLTFCLARGSGQAVRFRRFPQAARYDMTAWVACLEDDRARGLTASAGRAEAFKIAQKRLAAAPEMCAAAPPAEVPYVLPFGAPPNFGQFSGAWGGLSLFVPIGPRGMLAWKYVFKLMQSKAPGVQCRAAFDPTQTALPHGGIGYVFDYCICRAWGDLGKDLGAAADPLDAAAFGTGRQPLAAHVTLVVTAKTPVAVVDAIAECRGWAADSSVLAPPGPGSAPSPPGSGSTEGSGLGSGSAPSHPGGGGRSALCPPGGVGNSASAPSSGPQPSAGAKSVPGETSTNVCIADFSLTADEDPDVEDFDLRNVVRLLLSTLHGDAPIDLCAEALLYVYFIKHNQHFFAGSLQRIVSLDDGHCAAVLRDAAAYAYPGDDYGSDEWAHSCVPDILAAALSFESPSSLTVIGHADVSAVAETRDDPVSEPVAPL